MQIISDDSVMPQSAGRCKHIAKCGKGFWKMRLSQKRYRRNTATPRNPRPPCGTAGTVWRKKPESSLATPHPVSGSTAARLHPDHHNTPRRAPGGHYSDFDRAGVFGLTGGRADTPQAANGRTYPLHRFAQVRVRLQACTTFAHPIRLAQYLHINFFRSLPIETRNALTPLVIVCYSMSNEKH